MAGGVTTNQNRFYTTKGSKVNFSKIKFSILLLPRVEKSLLDIRMPPGSLPVEVSWHAQLRRNPNIDPEPTGEIMYPLDLETSQDYSRNQFSLCAHNETSTSVQT